MYALHHGAIKGERRAPGAVHGGVGGHLVFHANAECGIPPHRGSCVHTLNEGGFLADVDDFTDEGGYVF